MRTKRGRSCLCLAVCLVISDVALAQAPDTLRAIASLDALAVAEASRLEREVWPGYRFDSLGLMYIVPDVGKLALRWPGDAPAGMEAR